MKTVSKISCIVMFVFIFSGCEKEQIRRQDPCSACPIDFNVTDSEPAWSPDGKFIAFVHGDSSVKKTGIYLIKLITPDGKDTKLWHAGITVQEPTWSPDGKWIAFSENAQIWKKKVTGDSLTQLTFAGRNFFPSWSPDGKWIAFDSNTESPNGMSFIWKISDVGLNKKRIAYDPSNGEIRMPSWGENNSILHIRYLLGTYSSEVFSMDDEGKDLVRITTNNATDTYPRYSAFGGNVVFTSEPQNDKSHIWVINSNGTGLIQLTENQAYTCDWSPDGTKIVYTDSRADNGRLWLMNADGSGKQQLTYKTDF